MKFDPGHSRHTNIRDEARNVVLPSGSQEFFRGPKTSGFKSNRFNQILQCTLDRLVIIDDSNQLEIPPDIHVLSLVRQPQRNQSLFGTAQSDLGASFIDSRRGDIELMVYEAGPGSAVAGELDFVRDSD